MATARWFAAAAALLAAAGVALGGGDNNHLYQPCGDTKVRRHDGFTLGIVISRQDSFSFNNTLLSPCDRRLPVFSDSNSRVAFFRPKVDEISLLQVNASYRELTSNGYMVAFAGRKFAARSTPTFVGDNSHSVTGFTLVLEFQKGVLQNLYWKTGCKSCSGSKFVCLDKKYCAVKSSSCIGLGGTIDCSKLTIQVAFSGTDKNLAVLNSWYEVSNLQQYSLVGLYSGLKSSLGV